MRILREREREIKRATYVLIVGIDLYGEWQHAGGVGLLDLDDLGPRNVDLTSDACQRMVHVYWNRNAERERERLLSYWLNNAKT